MQRFLFAHDLRWKDLSGCLLHISLWVWIVHEKRQLDLTSQRLVKYNQIFSYLCDVKKIDWLEIGLSFGLRISNSESCTQRKTAWTSKMPSSSGCWYRKRQRCEEAAWMLNRRLTVHLTGFCISSSICGWLGLTYLSRKCIHCARSCVCSLFCTAWCLLAQHVASQVCLQSL